MKRKMITSGMAACLLLLLTVQCDKFTEVKYLTRNNFVLDSSNHEFKVETREEMYLHAIIINGDTSYLSFSDVSDKDTIVDYGDYSVLYIRDIPKDSPFSYPPVSVSPVEVTSEWFTLKKPYPYSQEMYLSVDENKENRERSLVIDIKDYGHKFLYGKITITQKGGS